MTKKQFISKIVEHSGSTKKEVEIILQSAATIIKESLIIEEKIPFENLGSFQTNLRKERIAQNLQTGAPVVVPAKRIVKFKPSKFLKEVVDY